MFGDFPGTDEQVEGDKYGLTLIEYLGIRASKTIHKHHEPYWFKFSSTSKIWVLNSRLLGYCEIVETWTLTAHLNLGWNMEPLKTSIGGSRWPEWIIHALASWKLCVYVKIIGCVVLNLLKQRPWINEVYQLTISYCHRLMSLLQSLVWSACCSLPYSQKCLEIEVTVNSNSHPQSGFVLHSSRCRLRMENCSCLREDLQ